MKNNEAALALHELSGDDSGSAPPLARQAAVMLALAVPMSSSNARAEESWLSVFEQSSSVYNSVTPRATRSPAEHILPVAAEQLAEVHAFFGLSKTQLAQVCHVKRQTVYDWYAGNFEAEGDNARRLARLYTLAQRQRTKGRRPLSMQVVKRAISSGNALVTLLTSDELPDREIDTVVAQLDQETSQRQSRSAAAKRQRLGWNALSEEAASNNLDANLEDVTDG